MKNKLLYFSYFKNKIYNLLDYANINIKRYDHTPVTIGFDPDNPLPYYLNQSHRANYSGPFDSKGVPLYNYKGDFMYFPIFICTYALGHSDLYSLSKQEKNLDVFMNMIDWLMTNQNENGVWLTNSIVKKFGLFNPWPSAMTQGLAISCLTKAYLYFKDDKYIDAAMKALLSFELTAEKGGVASYEGDWVFYDEYPSAKTNHVLNGFIFALWGLRDLINFDSSGKAKLLYDDGMQTLIEWLPKYDIKYWSLYHISNKGFKNPASLPYHRLHIQQLKAMFEITGYETFNNYSIMWDNYLKSSFNALRTLPQKVIWNIIYGL